MNGIYKEDSWSLSEARSEGKLWIVRSRSQLPAPADRRLYENLILVSWQYEGNESGMPEGPDFQNMNALEDAVEAGMDGVAVQAASVTGAGLKEWRYYARDTDAFMERFNASLAGHPAYPIELQVFADPEWGALAELLPE